MTSTPHHLRLFRLTVLSTLLATFICCAPGAFAAAPTTENFDGVAVDGGGHSQGSVGAARVINGWTFSVLGSSGSIDPNSFVDVTNLSAESTLASGSDHAAWLNGDFAGGTGTQAAGVLKATTGEEFSFTSIRVENGFSSSTSYRLVGYRNGSTVSGATQDFTASNYNTPSGGTLVTVSGAQWQNIDEVRIVQQNGAVDISIYVDDITVSAAVVPATVTSVNSSTANGTYKVGDTVSVQVNFSAAVTVVGTPQLTLETGTTDRVVNYASGSTTSTLTFTYTVQAGDTSADLDYQSTGSLGLNSGTIQTSGVNATLTLPSPGAANSLGNNKAIVIDGVAPTVTSVNSSTANGSYKAGDVVSVQVNFSESVTVTGTPQLTLETGTTDQVVNYASGSGTSTLTFTYTVQAGDTSSDLDYQSTTALALNGGTIKDAAGNNATLTLASPGAANSLGNNKAIVIDTSAPAVSSVNSSTTNGTYKVGDTVSVQVNFNEAVTVTGTPQLTLETGTTDQVVNYASGSGTSSLTFTYTVQAGDTTADLDYQSTTALALNSGTIKDAAGNNATLTLVSPGAANSLGNNKAIVVDGVAPTVTSVNSSTANGTYKAGDTISVQVNFSEAVTVTGTPQLTLETGATDQVVNYASGSGTSTLTFTYTVQAGDASADLDYQSTSALALNGGSIKDAAGNNATLTLASPGAANSLGNNKAIVVDTSAPTVSSVNSSTANGTYVLGEFVSIQVNFSEAVTVTGTPQLTLETGTTDRAVNYASGSGTSALTFTYTVQSGDSSSDLDYQSTTALALNGGTIKDAAGNNATLTLVSPGAANSLGNNKAIVINGVVPTVTSIATITPNGTYKIGDTVTLAVNFSQAVFLSTGTIQLTVETGTTDRSLSYVSGSGTSTLYFDYTVQAGDNSLDLDYVNTTSLNANGDTIQNASTQDAVLTLPAPGAAGSLGASAALVIDGVRPTASIVVSDPALTAGETSLVTITFSEAVTGLTTTDLTVANGSVSALSTGDGGVTWTATLTPTAAIADATNLITLDNTGVQDVAANTGTGTTDSNNYAIDTIVPAVTSVNSSTANGTYKAGDVISIQANFSVAVTVTGTPQLTLETGSVDQVVNYASGSGTSALTFTYTVQAGDTSADLDYQSTTAIALNGGTIKNAGGNNATLTLASPGAANSLGNNKAIVIDTTAPAAPSAPDLTSGSDTGASSTDNITNFTTPTFAGTAEASSTVRLYDTDGTTLLGSSTATGGIWAITSSTLSAGSHTVTAKATDAAGNASSASSGLSLVIDATAPTTTVATIAISADTGTSATDFITKTAAQTISGTLTANLVSGEIVEVSLDNGSTWTTATTSIGVNTWSLSGQTLASSNTLKVRVSDTAGNNGTVASQAYVLDTTAPTVTAGNITIAGTTGTAGAYKVGDTVTAVWNNTASGDNNADTIPSVTIDFTQFGGGAAVAASNSSGTWTATYTITVGFGAAGSRNVSVTAADNAGNVTTTADNANAIIENLAPVNSVPGAQSLPQDGTLVFSSGNANQISVSDADAGSASIQVTLTATHGTLTLSGVSGLTFTAGSGSADATMTFSGTIPSINTALSTVTYTPTFGYGGPATVQITTNDQGNTGSGGAQTDTDTIALTVVPANAAPSITAPLSLGVTEDVSSALTGLSFADPDAGSSSVAVTLTVGSGTLAATSGSGVTVGGTSSALTLTGSIANINAFIAAGTVKFTTAANATGNVTLTVGVNDNGNTGTGGAKTASTTVVLFVAALNDAPVNSVPGPQSLLQNSALTFSTANGNLISVGDVDAGSALLKIMLTATHGTLTLNGTTGVNVVVASGAGYVTATLTGAMADLNNALNGLTYTPTSGYFGSALLQLATSDQGNTGSGGTRTDTDSVAINVNPIVGFPVIVTQPESQVVLSGDRVTFAVAANGMATLTYQWQKNGVDLTGATGSSYVIPYAVATDEGNYTVVVSNPVGSVTSDIGLLFIIAEPTDPVVSIVIEPSDAVINFTIE